jgi:hypothetical protein
MMAHPARSPQQANNCGHNPANSRSQEFYPCLP